MKHILSKKMLILTITTLMILVSFSSFTTGNEEESQPKDYTHTVFVEVGTGSWCPSCPASNTQWHSYYVSGSYDFEYCEMVDSNSVADAWLSSHYNTHWFPTSYFDGGYDVVPGSSGLITSLNNAGDREVYDVEAEITSCAWLGTAQIDIEIEITNNEATTYNGDIRIYIIEEESTLWDDYNGNPYYHAFLDFALDQPISITSGNTYTTSTIWDGSSSYPGLTYDNCQVILAVFNDDFHQGYSDPPSGYPFTAYYSDDATSAHPVLDSGPPEISNAGATPSIQASGENVEISADVIDDAEVNEVKAVITDPDDTTFNETMTPDTGDTYTYDSTFSTTGVYSYYIWTDDVNGNQNISDVFTFEIMNPHITDLSPNWNFVALSLNQSISKTDLIVKYNAGDHSWDDAVTGGYVSDFIFGWDRSGQSYTFNNTLEPGYGYWVYAYNPCELWIPLMNANFDDYITGLKQNWNLVGSPGDENVSKGDLLIDGISWDDAVTGGYVSNFIFYWDRLGQNYDFTNILEPGYAYWMYAYLPCTLGQ